MKSAHVVGLEFPNFALNYFVDGNAQKNQASHPKDHSIHRRKSTSQIGHRNPRFFKNWRI
jgi:hypothetical protein